MAAQNESTVLDAMAAQNESTVLDATSTHQSELGDEEE